MKKTKFSDRCLILGELWLEHRDEEEFEDLFAYNDLGLPLAYAISEGVVLSTKAAKTLIDETWELFLGHLGIEEDAGFYNLDEVLDSA
jgi:hypothetical protein